MNTRKLLYLAMICLSVFASGLPAHAGMVGTEQFQPLTAPSGIEAQRDWIVEQLQKGGVQAPMAAERVAAMTDAEVAQVYQHIDELPAGGAEVLLVAIIVFLVLELTGVIDVIPDS
jgi:hypothetical protein